MIGYDWGAGKIDASPAVSPGNGTHVFVGSWDNTFYCIKAEDGATAWSYTTYDEIHSSAVVSLDGPAVYFGACVAIFFGDAVWSCFGACTRAFLSRVYFVAAALWGRAFAGTHGQSSTC